MKKNSVLKTAFLASCSFAGYNIGSGFATGVEGQQFFAAWGSPWAFISLLIAMAVTTLVFIPVYIAGYKKKADKDYNVYHFYCGDKLGTVIDWFIYFSILLIILTMMSGAGATVSQYFGIPKTVGSIALGALCVLAALLDLSKMMRVLSYVGIVIIAFVVVCTAYIRFGLGVSVSVSPEMMNVYAASGALKRIGIFGFTSPVLCGILSAGLLVVSSLPWVASTGALCENKKTAFVSGAMSGILFYIAQAVVVYLNLICMERIVGEEVPVLAAFQQYLPALAMAFSCVIILAIFSTVSGRLFLFSSRFDRGNKKAHVIISIAVAAASSAAGIFIPFSTLSNIQFTVNAVVGILLAVIILTKTVVGLIHPARKSVRRQENDLR